MSRARAVLLRRMLNSSHEALLVARSKFCAGSTSSLSFRQLALSWFGAASKEAQ